MTMAASEINQFVRVPRSLELEVDPATENIKPGENMKIDDILTDRLGFEDISPRASSEFHKEPGHFLPCVFERMAEGSIEDRVSTFSNFIPCVTRRNSGERCELTIPTIPERMSVEALTDRDGLCDIEVRSALNSGANSPTRHMPTLPERITADCLCDRPAFSDALHRTSSSSRSNSPTRHMPTLPERISDDCLGDRLAFSDALHRISSSSRSNSPTRHMPTLPERITNDCLGDRLAFLDALHRISSTGSLSSLASLPEKLETESQVPSSPVRIYCTKDLRVPNMHTLIERDDEEIEE